MNYKDCTDPQLLELLKKGHSEALGTIYDRYDIRLHAYLCRLLDDREAAEDILHNVFLSLWKNHATVEIKTTLETYLFSACKNKMLDFMRADKVRNRYAAYISRTSADSADNSTEELMNASDLLHTMEHSMQKLPERCQKVFRLSRIEHVSTANIAAQMNISPRTVENYISQALKHLRSTLGDFMLLIAGFIYLLS